MRDVNSQWLNLVIDLLGSNFCSYFFSKKQVAMSFFHCSSTPLGIGSIIEPGNWGRIIRNMGWQHNQTFRELVFEEIRARDFPNKPSRLDSIFFFDDENEAVFYANSDGRQFTMLAYEVELLEPNAVRHTTDWRRTSPQPHWPVDLSWIADYWNGIMLPRHEDQFRSADCREIFAVTGVRVVRRM